MKGRTEFRVYPSAKKKAFYTVFIFETKTAMQDHYRNLTRNLQFGGKYKDAGNATNFDAIAVNYGKTRQEIGQILFYSGFIGGGVASHEMTHAALYYVRNTGVKAQDLFNNPAVDEFLADTQGQLTRQFWVEYHRKAKRIGWLN